MGIAVLLSIMVLCIYMDYSDLSWSANRSNYISLLSASSLVGAMFASNRRDRNVERWLKQNSISNDTGNE